MPNMPVKITNPKSKYYQIQNKSLPGRQAGKIQNPKLKFWSLVIICNLVLCAWDFMPCYAAPCYGTKMPKKKEFFGGIQTHTVFKRYLKDDFGKQRSLQNFILLSYGVYDWLSIDLKGGSGYIKQQPPGGEEIDYPTRLGGGYGFRLKLYDEDRNKAVFGFQHISVHPRRIYLDGTKHKAVLDDWQFSLLASREFSRITPYIGTKWSRADSIHWVAGNRKREKSDLTKSVGLVFGFDLPFTDKAWLNLEGQLFDVEAFALSVNFDF